MKIKEFHYKYDKMFNEKPKLEVYLLKLQELNLLIEKYRNTKNYICNELIHYRHKLYAKINKEKLGYGIRFNVL